MIYPYSFFNNPFFLREMKRKNNNYQLPQPSVYNNTCLDKESVISKENEDKEIGNLPVFEILGIKLYNDDFLILILLLFLYEEDVHDQELFLALIMLLLS